MKDNVVILELEDKQTQAGKSYTRVKTDKGWMSAFNSQASTKLKDFLHKVVSVDIKENGKFKNIDKVYGLADNQTQDEQEVEIQAIASPLKHAKPDTARIDRAKALEIANGDIAQAEKYYKYIVDGEQ